MADTLGDMIRERAVERPDAPAITYQDGTITYGQLDARSNQVAHALRAAGIQRGDRVAILDKNVPEFFELLLGAGKLGVVLAAVNWRLAPPEIAEVVNDSTRWYWSWGRSSSRASRRSSRSSRRWSW